MPFEILRRVDEAWIHRCPGCGSLHVIPDYEGKPRWRFNGDYARPTLSPSVRHCWPEWGDGGARAEKVCHYFIRDGRIEFCGDCTHALAGQTVDLPQIGGAP